MQRRRLAAAVLVGATATGLTGIGAGSAVAAGSKPPIRLLVDGIETPSKAAAGITITYPTTGAQAAAAAINAAGGIDGRKVVIDVCDNKGDPNVSAQCARVAKSNGDIAVVATFDPVGARDILPVLKSEGIPYIGGTPVTEVELSSPVSFQFDPGPILGATALAEFWAASGCHRVASLLPANPGNDQVLAEQKKIGASKGMVVDTRLTALTLVDVTPIMSSVLAAKPDCFTDNADGGDLVKFILSAKKLGYAGKFIVSTGSLLPPFLKVLGPAGNGILALNSTLLATSNDQKVSEFRKDLTTYLKGNPAAIGPNLNQLAQDGWSSVQLVKQALAGSKAATSAYLLKKLPTMCNVDVGNVYPHVDFCKSEGSKLFPRVYNDEWQYFVVKNEQYASAGGGWHNLSASIPK